MVALAARSSGRSTEISSQTKITTVMLSFGPPSFTPLALAAASAALVRALMASRSCSATAARMT
jgi:hypothetical protein